MPCLCACGELEKEKSWDLPAEVHRLEGISQGGNKGHDGALIRDVRTYYCQAWQVNVELCARQSLAGIELKWRRPVLMRHLQLAAKSGRKTGKTE